MYMRCVFSFFITLTFQAKLCLVYVINQIFRSPLFLSLSLYFSPSLCLFISLIPLSHFSLFPLSLFLSHLNCLYGSSFYLYVSLPAFSFSLPPFRTANCSLLNRLYFSHCYLFFYLCLFTFSL